MLQINTETVALECRGEQIDDGIKIVDEWKLDSVTLKSFDPQILVQKNHYWGRFWLGGINCWKMIMYLVMFYFNSLTEEFSLCF